MLINSNVWPTIAAGLSKSNTTCKCPKPCIVISFGFEYSYSYLSFLGVGQLLDDYGERVYELFTEAVAVIERMDPDLFESVAKSLAIINIEYNGEQALVVDILANRGFLTPKHVLAVLTLSVWEPN